MRHVRVSAARIAWRASTRSTSAIPSVPAAVMWAIEVAPPNGASRLPGAPPTVSWPAFADRRQGGGKSSGLPAKRELLLRHARAPHQNRPADSAGPSGRWVASRAVSGTGSGVGSGAAGRARETRFPLRIAVAAGDMLIQNRCFLPRRGLVRLPRVRAVGAAWIGTGTRVVAGGPGGAVLEGFATVGHAQVTIPPVSGCGRGRITSASPGALPQRPGCGHRAWPRTAPDRSPAATPPARARMGARRPPRR